MNRHQLGDLGQMTVLLSYAENNGTLKIHRPLHARKENYLNIGYVLQAEHSFNCIEVLHGCGDSNMDTPSMLRMFNQYCPMISKLVINLGYFTGYSPGWDKEHREAIESKRVVSVRHSNGTPFRDSINICRLAEFQNLRELIVEFELDSTQTALIHPSQGCQAVREMFQEIEKRKQGVPLARLEVIWNTSWSNIYSIYYGNHVGAKIEVRITCHHVEATKGKARDQYVVTCDNKRYGKVIERLKTAEKLYGCRAWDCHVGPFTLKRLQGETMWMPKAILIDMVTRMTLLPAVFRANELKRAGRKGIFCV